MTNSIYIGKSYNLLDEFDSFETASDKSGTVLEEALELSQAVSVSNTEIAWDFIRLSLLTRGSALIEYLGLYQIPANKYDGNGFSISPNFLNENSEEDLFLLLSKQFGFEFNIDAKYAILELRREDNIQSHEVFKHAGRATFNRNKHLSKKWQFDSVKLRPGKKISYQEYFDTELECARAQKYIDTFYTYGTHFVSNIVFGDRILQFFEIKPASFQRIEQLYADINEGNPIIGSQTAIFNIFLSEEHCLNISNIISLAKDKELEKMLENGFLRSMEGTRANLILASPWNKETIKTNFKSVSKSVETQVTLRSMGRFLGYFRATNYDRILKGALAQRWGNKVSFPIRRLENVTRNLQAISKFPETALRINDSTFHLGDILYLSSVESIHSKENHYLFRLISLNEYTKDFQLSGRSFSSQYLEGASNTANSTKIAISERLFSKPTISCTKMYGSVIFVNEQSKEENLVYDGYRFAERISEKNGLKEIYLVGDILEPGPTFKDGIFNNIGIFSRKISAELATKGQEVEDVNRMKAFLVWLSEMSSQSFQEYRHVSDRCKYFGNSNLHSSIAREELGLEDQGLKHEVDQLLTKLNLINRFNATVYNIRSLENDLQADTALSDLLQELLLLEKSVIPDYLNVIEALISQEYASFQQKHLECEMKEASFLEKVLQIKSHLEQGESDEIVEYILFYLSQIIDHERLFQAHKNLIKSRFEEDKIKCARDFVTLLGTLNVDSLMYQELRKDINENKTRHSAGNLLKYLEEIAMNKEIDAKKHTVLFAGIRNILIEETKHLADTEVKFDELLGSFEELYQVRNQMNHNMRVLIDLQLNLYFTTNDQKQNSVQSVNLLKVNSMIGTIQYYRNVIHGIRDSIYRKEKQQEVEKQELVM